jgi:phage tail-like protein
MTTRTPSAKNPFVMPAEVAAFPLLYRSLIRPIREADYAEGREFLRRFYIGLQENHNDVAALVASVWDNHDPATCPDDLLQYLKDIVGFDAGFDYITSRLSASDLRKLIQLAIPLWKERFSELGISNIIRLLTGRSVVIYNWFHWRAILGEVFLSEEQQGYDFWVIGGIVSYFDEYYSQVRMMDDRSLDEQLVLDLLGLERVTSERIEVAMVDFLDQFDYSRDKWSTLAGTQASVATDKTFTIPAGTAEQGILTFEPADYVAVGKFKLEADAAYQADFYVEDWSAGTYYRITAAKNYLQLSRWDAGTETVLATPTLGFPIAEGLWYKLRASCIAEGTGTTFITDGDCEAAGIGDWDATADATLTKSTDSPHAGARALRVTGDPSGGAYQAGLLSTGDSYRMTGWFRGDGTNRPTVTVAGKTWHGTVSTTWQKFSVVWIDASNDTPLLSSEGQEGWAEFDDMTLYDDSDNRIKVYVDGNEVVNQVDSASAIVGGGFAAGSRTANSAPANLVLYARYNDFSGQSLDLDWLRDGGSVTGSAASGSPSISSTAELGAGSLLVENGGASEYVDYTGAGIVDGVTVAGCVEFFVRPLWTGNPSSSAYIFTLCKASGDNDNDVYVYQHTTGVLYGGFRDNTGAFSHQVSHSWSPVSGTWYHISLNWDFDAGVKKTWMFVDGTLEGSNTGKFPTRDSGVGLVRLGGSSSGASWANQHVDELRIYDYALRTADFTPPAAEFAAPPYYDSGIVHLDNTELYRVPLRTAEIGPTGVINQSPNFIE